MRIAKGYSDEQIEQMAKFFAAQKVMGAAQKFDAGKAKKGKALHEEYCERCHEDGGRDPTGSGPLAGQWMPYLREAINEFLTDGRMQPRTMKKKVAKMIKENGDGAIDDLINYYGSQQ